MAMGSPMGGDDQQRHTEVEFPPAQVPMIQQADPTKLHVYRLGPKDM